MRRELREIGPVGGVIKAMMARAPNDRAEAVQHAAEELEVYCDLKYLAGVLSCGAFDVYLSLF